jgi:hypothetical protein
MRDEHDMHFGLGNPLRGAAKHISSPLYNKIAVICAVLSSRIVRMDFVEKNNDVFALHLTGQRKMQLWE